MPQVDIFSFLSQNLSLTIFFFLSSASFSLYGVYFFILHATVFLKYTSVYLNIFLSLFVTTKMLSTTHLSLFFDYLSFVLVTLNLVIYPYLTVINFSFFLLSIAFFIFFYSLLEI